MQRFIIRDVDRIRFPERVDQEQLFASDSDDGEFFILAFGNKPFIEFFHVRVSTTGREGRHKEGFPDIGVALFGDRGFSFF